MSVLGTQHLTKQRHMQEALNVRKICYENFVSRLVYISVPFFSIISDTGRSLLKAVIGHEYKA